MSGSCVHAIDALHRVATVLEKILDALASNTNVLAAPPANDLMNQSELATRLGVSIRFVQRHITPSLRSGPRGKKLYRLTDVEAQLEASANPVLDRSQRASRVGSAKRKTTKALAPRVVSSEVEEVEAELRASLGKSKRRSS